MRDAVSSKKRRIFPFSPKSSNITLDEGQKTIDLTKMLT
jgi:hypothetical protein